MVENPTEIEVTEKAQMAARFVNSTNSHIFLTGKAGTGKTTFLRELSASTHKRHVILAPTGIAALNANGVTIHSQFLLPLGTFMPGRDLPKDISENANYLTEYSLARKSPLNAKRREVLRNIDLIIIDEVSMLRADLLDAIDYRMRAVKRNYRQRFGGVQVLMIGDLYQLPPVVRDHEWSRMREYYKSPHFFESKCLQEEGFVYIELDKIFRQQNSDFIHILNNLRNNIMTQDDIAKLNEHYRPNHETEDGVITITTHNRSADELNRTALNRLTNKSHYFDAKVEGDFPERIFPVLEKLELKEGAQVMFIKNDSQNGLYFNGKLATVISIDKEDIEVDFADGSGKFILRQETWENKKYAVNESTKVMEDEVVGKYLQYPVKLAWAITVHKSQGLTFEKAVIDVGRAFAPGQVYVALSRLTSLDGLVLRTPISSNVVSSDKQIVEFSKKSDLQDQLPTVLHDKQAGFLRGLLDSTFNFEILLRHIDVIRQKHDPSDFEDAEMRTAIDRLDTKLKTEQPNTLRFRSQLNRLLGERDHTLISERTAKGSTYYRKFLLDCIKELLIHKGEVEQFTRTKTYLNTLSELDLLLMKKLEDIEKSEYLVSCILNSKDIEQQPETDRKRQHARKQLVEEVQQHMKDNPKNSGRKTGRTRKKKDGPQAEVGATYFETFKLVKDGLTLDEIARKRDLKASTIETHFSRGIRSGEIELNKVMNDADVSAIRPAIEKNKEASMTGVYSDLKGKYSYGQLRMVLADVLNGKK